MGNGGPTDQNTCSICNTKLVSQVVSTESGTMTYWKCPTHGLNYYQEGDHGN